jgi:hypothetical protein
MNSADILLLNHGFGYPVEVIQGIQFIDQVGFQQIVIIDRMDGLGQDIGFLLRKMKQLLQFFERFFQLRDLIHPVIYLHNKTTIPDGGKVTVNSPRREIKLFTQFVERIRPAAGEGQDDIQQSV